MHRILVDELRWISDVRFLHALNYCHLLPGPEAQQLAIYIGWLMHRTLGGLIAGVLFVMPGVIALMALSWIYVIWGDVSVVAGLFFGLKAAVLAVVIEAVLRVGRRALKSRACLRNRRLAFVALFLFAIPFPIVVVAAAAVGFFSRSPRPAVSGAARGRQNRDATICSARRARTYAAGPRPSRSRNALSGCRFGSGPSPLFLCSWARGRIHPL